MSVIDSDQPLNCDNLLSYRTSSFQPCSFYRNEMAPFNKTLNGDGCCLSARSPSNILETTVREVSPGAPSGDHKRHLPSEEHKKKMRPICSTQKNELSPQVSSLIKSDTKNGVGTHSSNVLATNFTENGPKRGQNRSVPNSENALRNKSRTLKPRTCSADVRKYSEISPSRRRHISPVANKNKSNQQRRRSQSGKSNRVVDKPNLSSSSTKNNLATRKSRVREVKVKEGESNGQTENKGKATVESELIARRSAKDAQRQMRQKAKLEIELWKERMTKKKETCSIVNQGCFPLLPDTNLNRIEDQCSLAVTRKDEELNSSSSSSQPSGTDESYTQQNIKPSSPRKRENSSQHLVVKLPEKKLKTASEIDNIGKSSRVCSATVLVEKDAQEFVDVEKKEFCEILSSPVSSSTDDLPVTNASTKAASSCQLATTCGVKRNSASSRENQLSKIPRPVDGQDEKIKKYDSVESTSLWNSSSSDEKEEKAHNPTNPSVTSLSSPVKNAIISTTGGNVPESENPQCRSQQIIETVVELMRERRKYRDSQRMLHSTDDEEDKLQDSPSIPRNPPNNKKQRTRHHSQKSPKTDPSTSLPRFILNKRSSGSLADGILSNTSDVLSPSCVCNPDSNTQLSVVNTPRRKPYLDRKSVEIKLRGASDEIVDNLIRKRQRQEIYMLNQVMTALEFAQFEHFCRARNMPLSL